MYRLEGLTELVGLPYFPITPTFPFLGPAGLLPAPTKWRMRFGEPINLDNYWPRSRGRSRAGRPLVRARAQLDPVHARQRSARTPERVVRLSADGVLVVDKPGKATSHDIVAQARRVFGTRDVGHAGTLDPMATGVLLLLFGEATKLSGFLTRDRKRYRATVCFGRATDTLDADGQTTEEVALAPEQLTETAIQAALATEKARRLQVPPAVSAIKVDGRRSYALTRAGNAPALAEREVQVEQSALALALTARVDPGSRSLQGLLRASLGPRSGRLARLARTPVCAPAPGQRPLRAQ